MTDGVTEVQKGASPFGLEFILGDNMRLDGGISGNEEGEIRRGLGRKCLKK